MTKSQQQIEGLRLISKALCTIRYKRDLLQQIPDEENILRLVEYCSEALTLGTIERQTSINVLNEILRKLSLPKTLENPSQEEAIKACTEVAKKVGRY
jgi:hypothetical protein